MGLKIYFIGICGSGVGALAGLLKQLGHEVRGSDEHVYPPMSTKLQEWGIPYYEGYAAEHLEPKPDLVIVGNVVRATNPEAIYARKTGLPTYSMPEAIAEFGIGNKHSIVVSGTHGKTTTTALLAHVLMQMHVDPSFLVGGALLGYKESFHHGTGNYFVIEGDEYDTAYFDKGPKFWHYKPNTAIITSLEFDHADIYTSVEAIEKSFRGLIDRVPEDGHLVVWQGAKRALRLIEEHAVCKNITLYDSAERSDLYAKNVQSNADGLTFEAMYRNQSLGEIRVPLWGNTGVQNTLAVIAALLGLGFDQTIIREHLATFKGVKRRLEIRAQIKGITVVDDFAHHPTAVRETLHAAKTRFANQRIWAIFEPRSATTRRNIFQHDFVSAFLGAEEIIISGHARLNEIAEVERFNPEQLAKDIQKQNGKARFIENVDTIVETVVKEAKANDVILIFSNGDFLGLHDKLIKYLSR